MPIKGSGLPIHTKKVINHRFQVVYIDEFWEWAERNRSFIDFSKIEPLILGEEPEWVKEQRKNDFAAYRRPHNDPWTAAEDERLKALLERQKYTWAEISEILRRTEGAVQRRCITLGIKDRPVKADNHGESARWYDWMYAAVKEGIKNGECYAAIAKRIGKSEKAVRGKVYTMYRTENADKVREMIKERETLK